MSLLKAGYSFKESNIFMPYLLDNCICSHEISQKMFIIKINFSGSFPHTGNVQQELYVACIKYFTIEFSECKFGRG